MTDPDMGSWTYQYDANGNLWKQTDAKLQTITFTYDQLNRIKIKDYPSGTDIYYTYDEASAGYHNIGRLTTVTDVSGTEKLYYDEPGRVEKTVKTVYSTNYITETTRDELGRTDTIRYPDNTLLQYLYDDGGNISQVVGYATFSGYNALGQPGTVTYGNGVSTTYTYYTTNNRLNTIQTGSFQNLAYAYDNAGNITNITDNLNTARTQTFIYDDLNRLKQATSGSAAYGAIDYQYNEIGNMTYNSKVGSYTYWKDYYGTNKPHAVYKAGSSTYEYDENGNMIKKAGTTITYNYDNMPTRVGSTTFVYDYSGQRVKKILSDTTTIYIGKLYECTGVCTKYIFAGNQRVALKAGSATVYYYHTDHLGSSSVITRQDGTKYGEFYYHPYGKRWYTSGGSCVRHRFTGQEEDGEIGLYNYGARLYEPNIGRFISADSIVPAPGNPQSLNRYSYVLNNPIRYTDPSGHGFFEKLFGVVELIFGAVLTAYQVPVGPAIMAHGVYNIDNEANIDVRAQTPVASWGGSANGGGLTYVGPGIGYYGNAPGVINTNQAPSSTGSSSFASDGYSGWNNVVTINPEIFISGGRRYSYRKHLVLQDQFGNMEPYDARPFVQTPFAGTSYNRSNPLVDMAKATAFGLMATGIVTWEVGKIVAEDVTTTYTFSRIPFRSHALEFTADKTFNALKVYRDISSGMQETAERTGRRIEDLKKWWYEEEAEKQE